MKNLTLTLFLVILFGPAMSIAETDIVVKRNIAYLGDDRSEKLDVYLPPDSFERPRPAVVVIHGGAWRMGDKNDRREQAFGNGLAEEGYVVFSINYKLNVFHRDENGKWLGQTVAWPQNLYDCKTAVRYIRAHAEDYGVDPNRIAVMGGSAGGHLALLTGSTVNVERFNQDGLYLDQSNDVSCIVNFYGTAWVNNPHRAPKFEGGIPGLPEGENAKLASPATWLGDDTPPILIVHGDSDPSVSVKFSRKLVPILQEKGIEHTYIEIPEAKHSFGWTAAGTDVKPAVLAFLKAHL
ncbi:alpha/beta hydrolase [Cerasicoccus fimbriatus]|uniref:alpha/beta hydrolase n=1 Tax=Cerasicoccus fimbriatus TaxID=3014554 RepID=UPI0022B3B6EA|nr:alpha/beta hydrolase [Cerasicoccus sp. TK19100]